MSTPLTEHWLYNHIHLTSQQTWHEHRSIAALALVNSCDHHLQSLIYCQDKTGRCGSQHALL
jgi:hypothetical protein